MSTDNHSTADHRDTARTDRDLTVDRGIDLETLLAEEQTLPFCGLTPADATSVSYPDDVTPSGERFLARDRAQDQNQNQNQNQDRDRNQDVADTQTRSLKAVIRALPQASSGELRAVNEFVDAEATTIDPAEIRDVDGLDVAALEAATGQSLDQLAANAPGDRLLGVADHQDIIDRRRLALRALGYAVQFRWQIATDNYTIINPADAYLPLLGALQQHGADAAFGWAAMRDWGGVAKLTVILPGLRRDLDVDQADTPTIDAISDHDALADIDPPMDDGSDDDTDADPSLTMTVYGGIQTGYNFRGSQTMWAKPLLFFPGSGSVMYGVGQRYSRRHVGDATNAAHERAHDRVPIMEWWDDIYDALARRTATVNECLVRARAVAINFAELPYNVADFYTYLGIPETYAETASERARRLAEPASRPSLWNLQLSLLVALGEFDGARASDTFQAYNEVAQQILFAPGKAIQLAAREHDRQADADEPAIAPDQQTLSDALGDAVAMPGIEATTEADLSHADAQRVQNTIQDSLDM